MKTGRTQVGCSTPLRYWRGRGTISAARPFLYHHDVEHCSCQLLHPNAAAREEAWLRGLGTLQGVPANRVAQILADGVH
eukprot:scaffold136048_cov127-Phaeocystis_antarctica.AAC.1